MPSPIRERRAKHAEAIQKSKRPQQHVRKIALWGAVIVVILLVAGGVYALTQIRQPAKVHWHAKYQVIVDGTNVSFANRTFLLASKSDYVPAHLHPPDYEKIHLEEKVGTATVGSFFRYTLRSEIADDQLTLAPPTSDPGTFTRNATEALRLFVRDDQNWTEIPDHIADYAPRDRETFLILYGNYTAEQIAGFEAAAPNWKPGEVEPDLMPSLTAMPPTPR